MHPDETPTTHEYVAPEPHAVALASRLNWVADHIEDVHRTAIAALLNEAADMTIEDSRAHELARREIAARVELAQRGLASLREQYDEAVAQRRVALGNAGRYSDLAIRRDDDARMLASGLRDVLAAIEPEEVAAEVHPSADLLALLRQYAPAAGRAAEPDEDAAEQ